MKNRQYLAIIDWGIGGVSIYKLIKQRIGDVPIIYFSDTGATPYGKMSRGELVSRLNAVIEFLRSKGASHLVIGCNAASTAIDFLDAGAMKIEGVIESAVGVAEKMRPSRLAVIGGRRTVLSGIYRRKFDERGIKTAQRIAQPLSALIESGDISSDKLREESRKILAPIKNSSHILLACTHYPAIIPVLREFVSAETVFVNPAEALTNKIEKWNLPRGDEKRDIFLTTGDPEKMKTAARNAFGVEIKSVEKVEV